MVKVKESLYRPDVAQRVPGVLGSQICMTFGTWRWWGRHPHAPATFTPRNVLVLIFTRGWVNPRAMVRTEGKTSLKNPVTPLGIDPGTVWLVAQRLNHYATPDPSLERAFKFLPSKHTETSIWHACSFASTFYRPACGLLGWLRLISYRNLQWHSQTPQDHCLFIPL